MMYFINIQQCYVILNNMGNENSYSQIKQCKQSKLCSYMPITSQIEEECMRQILIKRPSHLRNEYICTVKNFDIVDQEKRSRMNCQQTKKLVIYYDYFDYFLADIPIQSYRFSTQDICSLLYCISESLLCFRKNRISHGDISLKNIVKKGINWQLVDKVFIRNGINAYERVLQGEEGFISPSQMQKIRHGFIRESPQILQADDIFSLGMVALQLASRKSSKKCYRESFIRFNENVISQHLNIIFSMHSPNLAHLISSMLQFSETRRISLDSLAKNELIMNSNKFSLKQSSSGNISMLKKSYINQIRQSRNYSLQKPQTRLSGSKTTFDGPQTNPIHPSKQIRFSEYYTTVPQGVRKKFPYQK